VDAPSLARDGGTGPAPHGGGEGLFRAEGISLRFGGVQALSKVSFSVADGAVHALIGPNGAGKTSLLNVISGLYRPDEGEFRLAGERLTGLPVHAIARAGVVRTFQNLEVFTNMTVLENVLAGGHMRHRYGVVPVFFRTPPFRREERALEARAREELDFVGISPDLFDRTAGELPFGLQRLLEIARALCAAPRLLLLDEPAAGLNMRETEEMGRLVRRIAGRGVTVLLVEHDMTLVMSVSDRVLVLNRGEVLAEGSPAEVQRNDAVVAAYLGEESE
jgi:branched-chain amino acid transport system ATP-binding protein